MQSLWIAATSGSPVHFQAGIPVTELEFGMWLNNQMQSMPDPAVQREYGTTMTYMYRKAMAASPPAPATNTAVPPTVHAGAKRSNSFLSSLSDESSLGTMTSSVVGPSKHGTPVLQPPPLPPHMNPRDFAKHYSIDLGRFDRTDNTNPNLADRGIETLVALKEKEIELNDLNNTKHGYDEQARKEEHEKRQTDREILAQKCTCCCVLSFESHHFFFLIALVEIGRKQQAKEEVKLTSLEQISEAMGNSITRAQKEANALPIPRCMLEQQWLRKALVGFEVRLRFDFNGVSNKITFLETWDRQRCLPRP